VLQVPVHCPQAAESQPQVRHQVRHHLLESLVRVLREAALEEVELVPPFCRNRQELELN